jgi:hypothetical protein
MANEDILKELGGGGGLELPSSELLLHPKNSDASSKQFVIIWTGLIDSSLYFLYLLQADTKVQELAYRNRGNSN